MIRPMLYALTGTFLLIMSQLSHAASSLPVLKEADWVANDFTFNSGEKMKGLRIHYYTLGDSSKPAVLLLHGTNQPISAFLAQGFSGELFGPGQALDVSKYFIIIPEGIGSGKSSKPSDGLRMAFPHYDYDDMVTAQYRLIREGLKVSHLHIVMGFSMGGMQTWLWGEKYPTMMDALVPMASQPNALSGRNWMLRRMLVESVKGDPAWNGGNYSQQPPALKYASIMFSIATTGGTLAYQHKAPTRAMADKLVDERLAVPVTADANDFIYIWSASADYNALPALNRIKAPVLIINSADDERNPVETGVLKSELKDIKKADLLIIPASAETSGHGTVMQAKLYKKKLQSFLATVSTDTQ